jgi:hypothetical protein
MYGNTATRTKTSSAIAVELISCGPKTLRDIVRQDPAGIPDVLTLDTLADVRKLVEKHLLVEYRLKFTWRQLAGLLKRAA